jgi:hypothetical protein
MSNEREVDQRFLGEGRKAADEMKKKNNNEREMKLSIVASASFEIFIYRKRKEENRIGEDRKRTLSACDRLRREERIKI